MSSLTELNYRSSAKRQRVTIDAYVKQEASYYSGNENYEPIRKQACQTPLKHVSRYLASASSDSTIKIFDLRSKKCIRTLIGHSDEVLFILSIGKKLLASSSKDKTVKIWNAEDGSLLATFDEHTSAVCSLELISENLLATGGEDGKILVWDLNERKTHFTIDSESKNSCMQFIEPNYLATCAPENKVRIWDLVKRECKFELEGHEGQVCDIRIVGPKVLASCSVDNKVILWDIKKGFKMNCFETGAVVTSFRLWRENEIACACSDGFIRVFDVASGELCEVCLAPCCALTSSALIDEDLYAVGGDDNPVKIVNLKAKKIDEVLNGHSGCIKSLAIIDI